MKHFLVISNRLLSDQIRVSYSAQKYWILSLLNKIFCPCLLENSYAMIINSLPKKADNPKSECFRVEVQLQCLLKCLRLRQRRFYGII